jgi:hypothetical protein
LLARDIIVAVSFPKGEKFQLKGLGKDLSTPLRAQTFTLRLKNKQAETTTQGSEFRYPTSFSPFRFVDPKADPENKDGYAPIAPTTFYVTQLGWSFDFEAEAGNEFITLGAKATHTQGEVAVAVHGEGAGPRTREVKTPKGGLKKEVIPQANTSGIVETAATNFQLFALPGKPYKVPVRRGGKTIQLTVTCNYAD